MLVSSFKRVTQKELWIFLTTFIASSLVFAAIVAVIRQVKKPCCSFLKIRLLWWMFLNNSLARSCVYHGSFLQNWKTVKGWGMNTKPPGWCTLGWCWSSLSLQSLSLGCGCYQPPCAPAPGSSANPGALLFRAEEQCSLAARADIQWAADSTKVLRAVESSVPQWTTHITFLLLFKNYCCEEE